MSESTESEHVRVDKWTVDPVSVALRASIDDEKTAFREPDKLDRRSWFETKTVDIWTSSREGARRLDRAYAPARKFDPDILQPYHPDATEGARLAVRLACTRPILSSDQIAWHDDLNLPDHRQINYLPYLPESVDELWHQWHLPREWPWLRLNAREVGNFQRKTEWDFDVRPPRAKRMAIAIHFPFVLRPAKREDFLSQRKGGKGAGRRTAYSDYNPWRDDPFIWSFAMSHSLDDGKTRAFLDGVTDYAFGDISHRILKAGSHWYAHPLHIPVILLDIFFFHAAWEINRLCIDVARFEDLSHDARVSSLDRYDSITTQLRYMRRAFDFQQRLTKFFLETLEFLENKVYTKKGDHMSTTEAYVRETNPHMDEKLRNTLGMIENNLQTCDYLQYRSKDALDFINGTIALRDQDSNRDDADSNKTMSFLQMTFLPATFVAAIMSINVFDFSQSPPAVSPGFWLFWVVSVVLTVVVLSVYFGAQLVKKQAEQREAAQAEQKDERDKLDLVRPPSGPAGYGDTDRRGSRRRRRESKQPKAEAAPA